MAEYKNFYEDIKEAEKRLKFTVVQYDGKPYYVLAICDHKSDGIFRVYLDDLSHSAGPAFQRIGGIPYEWQFDGTSTRGKMMDAWLDNNPGSGIIRKTLNSPKFNKFRPFPLGMVNTVKGYTLFCARSPTRHTQQGLTQSMVLNSLVSLAPDDGSSFKSKSFSVNILRSDFVSTMLGDYPTAEEVLEGLKDSEVSNNSAAFHRNFALMRGPLDLLFLAYKDSVVGFLPTGDFSMLLLCPKHLHVKESIEELGIFNEIAIKE